MNKYLLTLILQVIILTSPFINAMDVEPIVCQECCGWDDDWETPLYRACLSEHSECFNALLQQEDLQPNFGDFTFNRTPLHCLCINGNYKLATLLINYLCAHNLLTLINLQDLQGSTPLHHACSKKNLNIIRLLLVHKADQEILNNDSQKAYCISLCQECLAQENHGLALRNAARDGHAECLKILLNWSDKEMDQGNEGIEDFVGTLLHDATFNKHIECVRVLCQHKANPNALNAKMRTPLHMLLIARVVNKEAARAIIQILKEAGADVNAKDDWGWTPLSYAYYYKSDELGDFLKNQYGAVDTRIITCSNVAIVAIGALYGASKLGILDSGIIARSPVAGDNAVALYIGALEVGIAATRDGIVFFIGTFLQNR